MDGSNIIGKIKSQIVYINNAFKLLLARGKTSLECPQIFKVPAATEKSNNFQLVLLKILVLPFVKLNVDRPCKGNLIEARAGGVYCDHYGNMLLAFA